jgi:isoleucyl-tRNA synthetase
MQQNDYSKTIHLPQTSFPMKGNLPVREPELLEFWKRESVYQEMLKNNEGNQKFILPDGPPYANGSIHIGHTLNKILKDMIIKYRNLSGYYAAFIPGWDCHGLPIEHAVTQALNSSQPILASEVRSLCRAEAQKWIDHQKTQFQRLGVFGDWDRPYKTMDPTYEAEIVRGFALLFERGYIYRSNKPVYWNTKLQTALADAEVEYHNKKSPSIYVEFAVDSSNLSKRPFKVLIWTTTPWTLPANLGICLHPELDYGLYESVNSKDQPELYLIAKGRAEALAKEVGRPLTWVQDISSRALEREVARHPFYEREALFVLGEHVTLDAGTGCVHTAPGHGPEDYKVGLRYGLPALSPVGPDGRFTKEAPGFEGK